MNFLQIEDPSGPWDDQEFDDPRLNPPLMESANLTIDTSGNSQYLGFQSGNWGSSNPSPYSDVSDYYAGDDSTENDSDWFGNFFGGFFNTVGGAISNAAGNIVNQAGNSFGQVITTGGQSVSGQIQTATGTAPRPATPANTGTGGVALVGLLIGIASVFLS